MSNAKSWETPLEERMDTKSIYLAVKDWEYLAEKGNGKPGKGIKKLIAEKLAQENYESSPSIK